MQIPVLSGDGIGPEITAVTVQVLERLDRSSRSTSLRRP